MSRFPEKTFVAVVAAVCLGLAFTGISGYIMHSRFREEYLKNHGNLIAVELDRRTRGPEARSAGVRGPGMRGQASFWQAAFEDAFEDYREAAAFLALVDESGGILASAGEQPPEIMAAPPGFVAAGDAELFIFESYLGPSRSERAGKGYQFGLRRVRIGLYTSAADAIRTQAFLHLAMTGAALLMLIALAYYFLRTLHRFVQLQAREGSARHLAALGTMAATLAHEIRNPLGAMKGLTQLAQEELAHDHAAQSFMRTVVSEAERLEQLVTDLLVFAGPKDPVYAPFDFLQLLGKVRMQVQKTPEAEGKTIEVLSGRDALPVDSDENGLRQILLNILRNAIEASPPGGRIAVRADMDGDSGMLTVAVEDEGSGLDGSNAEKLFEPFVTTKTKGTGLGLAASRRIASALGGTLTLSGRAEGGARCELRVPGRPASRSPTP